MNTVTIHTGTGFDYHRVARDHPAIEPNYAARRIGALFVLVLTAFAAVTLVNSVLASFSGQSAEAAGARTAVVATESATHVARVGDTMWSIADQYRGDVNRHRYIDALVNLNSGTDIVVGQAIVLP